MSYNAQPKEWYRVDKFFHKVPYAKVAQIYRECDILIKTSVLESFSYPPLEMMANRGLVGCAKWWQCGIFRRRKKLFII